ncbi:FG-GAP repeat protein [Xanthomonas floridensis]|nr:FG-GAP repeat protein [Xanthomonas floridensis]MEA5125780.1 FG-GAP repeat protein [Xanthomonas floridensis]MEA5133725.1 FG-GAP repeat protein [Xanthomonas floridensis]
MAAGLLPGAAAAAAVGEDVMLDAHTRARATLEGTRLHVVVQPGSQEQWLDADLDDGNATGSVHSDDYNFDGYPDLAVTAMLGQVNEATRVFLYDSAQRRFRLLTAPARPAVQCEGFWNLTPDLQQRSLSSSCRSGPMWYSDVYRYAPDGRLYVYTTQQRIESPAIQEVLGPGTEDGMPFSVWPRFDAHGAVIDKAIGQSLDAPRPATFQVQVPRLPLYATATAAATRRYLIKGDRLQALDVSADQSRVLVRYRSASHGVIEGWIRADEAMP